jgi:hypothetical protein
MCLIGISNKETSFSVLIPSEPVALHPVLRVDFHFSFYLRGCLGCAVSVTHETWQTTTHSQFHVLLPLSLR